MTTQDCVQCFAASYPTPRAIHVPSQRRHAPVMPRLRLQLHVPPELSGVLTLRHRHHGDSVCRPRPCGGGSVSRGGVQAHRSIVRAHSRLSRRIVPPAVFDQRCVRQPGHYWRCLSRHSPFRACVREQKCARRGCCRRGGPAWRGYEGLGLQRAGRRRHLVPACARGRDAAGVARAGSLRGHHRGYHHLGACTDQEGPRRGSVSRRPTPTQ